MVIFDKPGRDNAEATAKIAMAAAKERGITTIVTPSTSGYSGELLKDARSAGIKVVLVSHVHGFKNPGEQRMPEEKRQELLELGYEIVTATHVLSGAERGLSNKFSGVYPVEIIAHTLRMMGAGTKVAVECAVMALDAGKIGYMEPILALGGTGKGIDTALIMRTSHGANILDCRVDEFLCKPRP